MEQTLQPGDRVVVDKRAYGLRIPFTLVKVVPGEPPARGDVIVFDAPDDGTRLIKRIVAVGGDLLEVRDGHVFINGIYARASRVYYLAGEGFTWKPL
jgi:signal peptidase I